MGGFVESAFEPQLPLNTYTGWAQYADTEFTPASPFSILADVDTILPNNAGSVIDAYKPTDITAFYDAGKITGRAGDGILITVDCNATPTSASATYLEIWFDIGGAVGELYRRIVTFPKGNGVLRPINFTVAGYTLDTWEANGAITHVRSDGPVDISNIRYVVTRTHKA